MVDQPADFWPPLGAAEQPRLLFTRPREVPRFAGEAARAEAARAEAYRPGNVDDFDRLYRASYARVVFTLLAIVRDRSAAEDCAQEAFVRAFKRWGTWRPEARAETWLHTIAINVAISYRRRERNGEIGEVLRRFGRPRQPDRVADGEAGVDLLAALRRLPHDQAAATVLRYHHGYTNREIGAALRVPESTIASRLATARRRLRELLGDAEAPWSNDTDDEPDAALERQSA